MVCITNIGLRSEQLAFVGKFFFLWVLVDGKQTKVSFLETALGP